MILLLSYDLLTTQSKAGLERGTGVIISVHPPTPKLEVEIPCLSCFLSSLPNLPLLIHLPPSWGLSSYLLYMGVTIQRVSETWNET